jgi:hypothetical protein
VRAATCVRPATRGGGTEVRPGGGASVQRSAEPSKLVSLACKP